MSDSTSRRPSHARWRGALLAAIACLVLLTACQDSQDSLFQGYVEGDFVYVAPAMPGRMLDLAVQRGDMVAAGDLLFTQEHEAEQNELDRALANLAGAEALLADKEKGLRPTELEQIDAELEGARTALNLAARELQRRRELFAQETISQEELDRARTEHDRLVASVRQLEARLETASLPVRQDLLAAARAEYQAAQEVVDQARWNLSQKEVLAPEQALVFDTLFRPGEFLATASPVVVLLPPAANTVRFFVPQEVAGALALGQDVVVSWDGAQAPVAGQIGYISPEVEYTPPVIYSQEFRSKLVFMVEAVFPPQVALRLHPGQPVDVAVPGLNQAEE